MTTSPFVIPNSSLPALVESTGDVWGLQPEPDAEQLPPTDLSVSASQGFSFSSNHTLDYWERERLYDRIQRDITECKILLGMASRWPRVV